MTNTQYSGSNIEILNLAESDRKALELLSLIKILAHKLAKTQRKAIDFNIMCEKLITNTNNLELARLHLKALNKFKDEDSKKLYIIQEASNEAVNLDLHFFSYPK